MENNSGKNNLYGSHILRADQFNIEEISYIIAETRRMRDLVKHQQTLNILSGRIMTALFYEPSSRTYGSFISSMQRLGGGFIPIQGVVYSSVAKGESLPDTICTFSKLSDVIVLRHSIEGAAEIASRVSSVPIINAGDGIGEHPTQALLDLFTITDRLDTPNGKIFTLVGDLKYGRTVHSLITLLFQYKPKIIYLISPIELKLPQKYLKKGLSKGVQIIEKESLGECLDQTDVLYMTRIQKERFTEAKMYDALKDQFIITPHVMNSLKKSAILMHPFPRVSEITTDVDCDPRALYLREQIQNGMYVRMALLSLILNKQ
jgi:aspartate carbamoyltransferase